MPRLYLRFYFALLGSLLLFGLATATLWHFTGGSLEQTGATLGRLVQNVLPPADSPAAEQQEALRRLALGLNGKLTLFAGKSVQVIAGRDITDVALYVQNNRSTDVTTVAAGRDLIPFDPNSTLRTLVQGSGQAFGHHLVPQGG